MAKLDDQQRAGVIDRLYRQIAQLDDDRLIRLTTSLGESLAAPAISVPPPAPSGVGRREFLLGLIVGAGVSIGTGLGIELASTDKTMRDWLTAHGLLPSPTPTVAPTAIPSATALPSATPFPTATAVPTLPPEIVAELTDLRNQVAALTTDRDAQRTRADGLDKQLSTITADRDNLSKQVTTLTNQLQDATTQISTLTTTADKTNSLLDAYKQLDTADLDSTVTAGEKALETPFQTLDTTAKALDAGLRIGKQALQGAENQLPTIVAGLDWLDQEVATLTASFRAYQTALNLPDNTDPVQATNTFIQQVLDYLPFTASQDMRLSLQAVGTLVSLLPEFLNNVNHLTIAPARIWLTSDQQTGLYALLLTPINDQVFGPAQQMIDNAENLKMIYNNQLVQPAQIVLDQRVTIHADISKKTEALQP